MAKPRLPETILHDFRLTKSGPHISRRIKLTDATKASKRIAWRGHETRLWHILCLGNGACSTARSMNSHRPDLLLVEDDHESLFTLATLLRLDGWHIATATHGAEALAKLQAGLCPRIIVTDYMMPVMDGLTMIEALRRDLRISTPAVLITAAEASPRLVDAFDRIVQKPFSVDQLIGVLHELTALSRSPIPASNQGAALDSHGTHGT